MNVHGVRRNLKNVVKNYSDAQVKVREATSNDPWGPSSTLMSEVADLTYNVVAFSEIMQLVWKRLNDHGKNWRHVYKALVLLEYLIKTGSERVAQQCKENIFAIQTLKDFQYVEDNKDQGINVREKAKQLVSLLKDDERLKNERARALKAKERFAQSTSGIGSDEAGSVRTDEFGSSDSMTSPPNSDLESARPHTVGEEELQLQLALAMSKEEADQEERVRRGDDVRLQMALSESKDQIDERTSGNNATGGSAVMDLLDVNLSPSINSPSHDVDPWGVPLQQKSPQQDPWNGVSNVQEQVSNDPWAPSAAVNQNQSRTNVPSPSSQNDLWASSVTSPVTTDPWMPVSTSQQFNGAEADSFEAFSNTRAASVSSATDRMNNSNNNYAGSTSPDLFDMNNMSNSLNASPRKKSAKQFLGANSSLVNLDALVSSTPTNQIPGRDNVLQREAELVAQTNPFAMTMAAANPFQSTRPQPPSINQLRASQSQQFNQSSSYSSGFPNAMMTGGANVNNSVPQANNPFL